MQATDQLKNNMNESELLIEPYPVVKPGGQYVGVVSSAVQVTHIPTGLKVICSHERSQSRNKNFAISMIEQALTKII
jgi:protein subunit release factor A